MDIQRANAPGWIRSLLMLVDDAMTTEYPGGVLGYLWIEPQKDDGPWRVCIFPTPGEVIEAGPNDGKAFVPGFKLDLRPFIAEFDRLANFEWYAPSDYSGELDGPCVCLQGSYKQFPVVVCVFDESPKAYKPLVIFDRIKGETRLKRAESNEDDEDIKGPRY